MLLSCSAQTLLPVALFLIENALSLSVATTAFLFFCALTRLFSSDSDGEAAAPSPTTPMKPEPLPRWEVLRVLNYLVIAIFVAAVTFATFNYRTLSHVDGSTDVSLFPILVICCVCMAYFFGFFGISFLDKNAMERSPSAFALSHLDAQLSSTPHHQRRQQQQQQHHPQKQQQHASTMCKAEGAEQQQQQQPVVAVTTTATTKERSGSSHRSRGSPSRPAPLTREELAALTDAEVAECVTAGTLKDHQLETRLGDHARAVRIRRCMFEAKLGRSLAALPHEGYDYERIFGANCEIVCGYVPVPVGVVGPLLLDGAQVYIPMATTEGCLVASTNRGAKAISQGGGCRSVVLKDGITRAPCLRMPDAIGAASVKQWVETPEHFAEVKAAFESTTSFGKLQEVRGSVAGRNVYLRFVCFAGDAMGMNMVSKGCLAVVELLQVQFPEMELIAISGNMCTDKKPAAINWIEGRGKSVVCEARIPGKYVASTLKTTVAALVQTNIQKNLVGSAMAGALGGFNAHASNIVTAVFMATGQDPAQNVESSMCMTLMEETAEGDLLISVNMPCLEVGTVGGGTSLPAQGACLDIIGCRGASQAPLPPGTNAQQLARVVAGAVLAGELSLMAALASNQLVRAHMQHNRKKA
jgi:hydroxymethylglutaryl-CoA reductase (NADPH)